MDQAVSKEEQQSLTDWYDKQTIATRWRIAAYLVRYERPLTETLGFFKAMDDQGKSYLSLVHSNPQRRH